MFSYSNSLLLSTHLLSPSMWIFHFFWMCQCTLSPVHDSCTVNCYRRDAIFLILSRCLCGGTRNHFSSFRLPFQGKKHTVQLWSSGKTRINATPTGLRQTKNTLNSLKFTAFSSKSFIFSRGSQKTRKFYHNVNKILIKYIRLFFKEIPTDLWLFTWIYKKKIVWFFSVLLWFVVFNWIN